MPLSVDDFIINEQAMLFFTWIVFDVICQALNIFGIFTNIINIVCFTKQGFEDSANISLLGLAVSDLGSLITMTWTCVCLTPAINTADLTFDPMEVMYLTSGITHFSFTRVSSCITAMITLERCLCITVPLKVKNLITSERAAVIIVLVFLIFLSTSTPFYVVNSLGVKFSSIKNKTLYGLIYTDNREEVELVSYAINSFSIPFGAFAIIVVCTAIISFKLRSSSKWRQKTVIRMKEDKVSTRSEKAAKMVVMISTLFIICFIPVNVNMLAAGFIPEMSVSGKLVNLSIIICGFGYVMESINSSMNIFIYYHMSSRYRDNFIKLFLAHKAI